ncbi:MAG: transcription factor S [Candidatus Thermoplasmatota archaeon]|nr:transcription factor S [Candidatus Thermoplasmatota archaeon]
MFCPNCKSLMYPYQGKLKCKKCQTEKEIDSSIIVGTPPRESELKIIEKREDTLPSTRIECPECNNKEAHWVIKQIRGGDEPETKFYICTRCRYVWREE